MKKVLCLALVVFLTTPLFAQNAQKHKIKDYVPKVGDCFLVQAREFESQKSEIGTAQKQLVVSKTTQVYIQRILEVNGEEPTKMELTFQEVHVTKEMIQNGATQKTDEKIPLKGVTVVVTYTKGQPAQFKEKTGKDLGEKELEFLKKKFGSSKKEKEKDNPFIPQKAVSEGETWSYSIDKIGKMFEIPNPKDVFDAATSSAKGTLKKVRTEGKSTFGEVEIKVHLVIKSFPQFDKASGEIKIGGHLNGCMDGSVPKGKLKVSMSFVMRGEVQGQTVNMVISNQKEASQTPVK